jgi:acyl-coenzyme A synthetase/AMP-(fatty) acid ligase
LAVWSGDQVIRDEEGYFYFVSRMDDMIKTSGFRVSPTEVEESAYRSGLVAGATALGLSHRKLGQAILLVVTRAKSEDDTSDTAKSLLEHLRSELPNFMLPQKIIVRESMLHNQNGKIDRRALAAEYQGIFEGHGS